MINAVQRIPPIELIDFVAGRDGGRCCRRGWLLPEAEGVWSVGARSELDVTVPQSGGPFVIELDIQPYLYAPVIRGQLVTASVNGRSVGSVCLGAPTCVRIPLADEDTRSGSVRVELEHPCYYSASDIELAGGPERRAICMSQLRLYPAGSIPEEAEDGAVLCFALPASADRSQLREPQVHDFRSGMPGEDLLREGWWPAEPELTWASGPVSRIHLPAPAGRGSWFMEMKLRPFQFWGEDGRSLGAQRLTVVVNGFIVGQHVLRENGTLAFPLAEQLIGQAEGLDVALLLPDGAPPSAFGGTDDRMLAIALYSIVFRPVGEDLKASLYRPDNEQNAPLGRSTEGLLAHFESLGSNCEFGLAQRFFNYEPTDVFRFGTLPLATLMAGLGDDCFQSLGDPANLAVAHEVMSDGKVEKILYELHYNLRFHTFIYKDEPGDQSDAEILTRQAAKLRYGRRKFLAGLRSGRKIYVLRRDSPLTLAEVMPVFTMLREYGGSRLLYVADPAVGKLAGHVDLIAPGLMRGYVLRWNSQQAVDTIQYGHWMELCANAWLLDHQ